MMVRKKLIGTALLLISINSLAAGNPASDAFAPLQDMPSSEATQTRLAQQVIDQLRALDHALEDMGCAVNCRAVIVADKEAVTKHILELRAVLVRYLGTYGPAIRSGQVEASSVRTLLDVESGMLAYLNNAVSNGFTSMDAFDEGNLVTRNRFDAPLDVDDVQAKLARFAQEIRALDKEIKNIGYSTLNRFSRKVASLNKKTKFSKLVRRSLPYVGLGLYLAWATDQLPDWEVLKPVKNLLKKDEPVDNVFAADRGVLHKVHRGIKKVLTIGVGHKKDEIAIFNVAAGTLLAKVLSEDIKDFSQWCGEQTDKAKAFLQGKPYESAKSIKVATKIRMKDVVGAESAKKQLGHVIDYFKGRANHDRAGAYIDRSYFLVGPLDSSKLLAYAIVGDVNAYYKEKKKSTEMSIYEIHSSELISKDLKTILKEAGEKYPCVVLIQDIDWLHAQHRVDPKVWSDLASAMQGIFVSKKQIFVIATARDASALASHHKGHLGMVVHVNNPTYEDRAEYIKREFEKRSILPARFDMPMLARETKDCTFAQLTTIINRSLNIAHTKGEILAQAHLEEAINEVAHGIVIKSPEEHERKLLAAYYAGKVLAHKVLLPEEAFKVTIYPVLKAGKESSGAIFSHAPRTALTDGMIEKAAIIELAGAEAQKLLTGTESQQISQLQNVQASLKKVAFKGVEEGTLTQESRGRKLQEAEAKFAACAREAARIARENQQTLKNLAQALEEKMVLNDIEIEQILGRNQF